MQWKGGRRSNRVSDRRGRGVKAGGIGFVGILIILAGWYFGIDPRTMMAVVDGGSSIISSGSTSGTQPDKNDETAQFMSVIFASNQDVWQRRFEQSGQRYQPASLVIFDGNVQSACGVTSEATGPFYCPGDHNVYVPPSFINELKRLGGSGDFAFAYVIAHEVGHHVQNLLGTLPKAHEAMRGRDKAAANQISVAIELQADCYAGIWAHDLEQVSNIRLEAGDLNEGLEAASAVGDDHILADAGRHVHPEQFTHGSAAQRRKWLTRGIERGSVDACNTFN
ncbi:neutral zinc metallopeptidase [Cardiobacteriaceae bacterium TAE3-ERU3]|nr:neutral zinc metallopeptidase [Cardiobacteriaceae bacterium TAE3-ERU3]